MEKAQLAGETIARESSGAVVELAALDLSDLRSVRDAAEDLGRRFARLDLLINNAGVAWPPLSLTAEGLELQFAVNHIGHFALTGLVLEQLLDTPGSRVVNLSSLGHWVGRLRLDDPAWKRGYKPFGAYAQSKLATLMFTYELQRRLSATGRQTLAVAAHPGGARSELIREPIVVSGLKLRPSLLRSTSQFQSAAMGALAVLRAAVDPNLRGGEYLGPGGFLGVRGYPKAARSSRRARDRSQQQRLWQLSEQVTGVTYRRAWLGPAAPSVSTAAMVQSMEG